jgi:hypothetical protein
MMCSAARVSILIAMAIAVSACQRRETVMSPSDAAFAEELEGVWDVSYSVSESPVLTTDARSAPMIAGRIALISNESITTGYSGVRTVTNYGSYDVDFSSFGFDSPQWGKPSTVVAGRLGRDSAIVLLSPGASAPSIRMSGAVYQDSIKGKWTVSLTRISGGGGDFTMRRRR